MQPRVVTVSQDRRVFLGTEEAIVGLLCAVVSVLVSVVSSFELRH